MGSNVQRLSYTYDASGNITAVPVVGFVVGFLVGLGIGTLISIVDYWLPQVRQGIKDFVYGCYLTVIDIGNKIGYIFEDIWQSICNAFRG